MSKEKIDRRNSGVHKIVCTDEEEGTTQTRYSFSVTRVKAWLGVITAIIGIAGMIWTGVWAVARFGIRSEAYDLIKIECEEDGIIRKIASDEAMLVAEELQSQIQDNLDYLDGKMQENITLLSDQIDVIEQSQNEVLTGQSELAAQQTRNTDELKMLLQRAINGG